MQIQGYALTAKDGTIVAQWRNVPGRLNLPNGDIVFSADSSWTNGAFTIAASTWTEPDPPPPPTNADIYSAKITSDPTVKALIAALNDGSFVPGQKQPDDKVQAILQAKM